MLQKTLINSYKLILQYLSVKPVRVQRCMYSSQCFFFILDVTTVKKKINIKIKKPENTHQQNDARSEHKP